MSKNIDGKNLIALLLFNDWLVPQSLEQSQGESENSKETPEENDKKSYFI